MWTRARLVIDIWLMTKWTKLDTFSTHFIPIHFWPKWDLNDCVKISFTFPYFSICPVFFLSFNFSLNGMHSISFANRYWNLSFGITDRTICKLWRNANELVPDLKMFCMMSWWCVCVSLWVMKETARETHTWWKMMTYPLASSGRWRERQAGLSVSLIRSHTLLLFSPLSFSPHVSCCVRTGSLFTALFQVQPFCLWDFSVEKSHSWDVLLPRVDRKSCVPPMNTVQCDFSLGSTLCWQVEVLVRKWCIIIT